MEEYENEENECLDDRWIKEFEETDQLYKDFYKDNVQYIPLTILYVNESKEIQHIKQETFLLSKYNQMTYEEIRKVCQEHSVHHHKTYSLHSILKYNFDLEPDDLKLYLSNPSWREENYLTQITHLDTIHFQKTICMFQDTNELILIFFEKHHDTLKHHGTHKHLRMAHKKTKKQRNINASFFWEKA